MNTMKNSNRILALMLMIVLVLGTMSAVFAGESNPTINFTSSGVNYNKENKLLRFNLKWSHPQSQAIDVMYSIDGSKAQKLGSYDDQDDQVIAHIYLDDNESTGSILEIYAVDNDGNESDKISSEFQIASSPGITIVDDQVPLSVPEGTWSLINLFLAALSVAMVAVSAMLYIENRVIENFRNIGKIKSVFITLMTIAFTVANIIILLATQNLKHQMVMFDNMTVAMLIIAIMSIGTTILLAVRAFSVQYEKDMIKNN